MAAVAAMGAVAAAVTDKPRGVYEERLQSFDHCLGWVVDPMLLSSGFSCSRQARFNWQQ
jgi:hypothetical protein